MSMTPLNPNALPNSAISPLAAFRKCSGPGLDTAGICKAASTTPAATTKCKAQPVRSLR